MPAQRNTIVEGAVMSMSYTHYYSKRCFVCGAENPRGLRARFVSDGDTVNATVRPAQEYQGFDGVLHGGIISALLDEALWYVLYAHGLVTVTVKLELTIRRPVIPGELLRVRSCFVGPERRYLLAEGEISNAAGELVAEAKGRFLPAPHLEQHLGETIIAEHYA